VLDLTRLNPPQRQAVTIPEGPALVLAGAGSGKTRVIAHRIAWLVDEGSDPSGILAVTFTNKAAKEMRDRVRGLCRREGEGALIATFHSFGLWFLRQEHELAGLPKWFSICDSGDQTNVLKRCMKDVQVDSRRFDVRHLLGILSRRRSEAAVPDIRGAAREDEYEIFADEILPRYEQALRAQRSLDFEDLIVRPVTLLAENRSLRTAYRERFRHVLVDEYQDTNRLQLRLLELLCGPEAGGTRKRRATSASEWSGRSLCAVGDDDQSIYGWRGAEVKNILRFETHFPGAQVIRLEQNYRSTGNILGCANGVISRAAERRPKRLWTETGGGDPVRVVALPSEEEEARFAAGEIARGMSEGRSAADFAVLYRLNAQSQSIEEALREVGIQHKVKGGPAFFDRSEVRDVLAWLRICAFPDDDVALARVVHAPPRGIGDVAMARLADWAALESRSAAGALELAGQVPDIPRGAPEKLAEFAAVLADFRRRFRPGRLVEPARTVFDEIDLRSWLRRTVLSPEAGTRKAEAVDAVLRSLENYERRDPKGSLGAFLQRLALDSRDDEPDEVEGVTLSTLHAAKGLEFPVVFVIGFEEDLLPVAGIQGEARDLEEERRLAYVGITRAREQLWLTRATARTRRGRIEPRTPSRFLEDLPAESRVRHDPESAANPEATAARSAEVLKVLRSRLASRR
jgi:DNA helicase-2/ATP-dependent DNA helicase PcrA